MSVEFKSPVTSSNVNQAFLDKNKDTETQFKLALNRTGSGDPITDTQQAINDNATNLEAHEASYIAHREFDTKANLDTWATTADNGSFAFATDEKKSYQVIDGVLAEIGGGGGGLNEWITLTDYVIGDVIWLAADDKIYRCTADNSDATFTPANWQELSENPYVNNLTVTAQDNLTITDSVGTRLLKSENYELYYQDFKDALPSTIFSSTSASLTVNDVTGTEINTSNTMASITQSGASPADSTEIVLPLPTKKQDWILTPIKILEMLEVTGGNGTFGVTLQQSNDGITFTALGSIPQLGASVSLNKSVVTVNADSTHIKIKFSVIVADNATTLNVHRILISTDALPVGQTVKIYNVYAAGGGGSVNTTTPANISFVSGDVGLWSGTEFTAPAKGKYLFTGSLRLTSSSSQVVVVYKNTGSGYSEFIQGGYNASSTTLHPYSFSVELNRGEQIQIRTSGSTTLANDTEENTLTISGIAYADNVIVDAAVSGLNIQSWNPTVVGFGTTTNKIAQYAQSGNRLVGFYRGTGGTTAVTEFRLPLPNGYTCHSAYTENTIVGTYRPARTDASEYSLLALAGNNYLTVGYQSSGASTILVNQNGNVINNNATDFGITFDVAVNELDMSSQLISLDVSSERENVYSARIVNNGTATITSQSSPFVESVSRFATGEVLVTFKSGFFPVIPAVEATAEKAAIMANITAISTTSVSIRTEIHTGTKDDSNFAITVQRQGADYRPPTAYIAGQVALTQVAYLKDVKSSGTAGGGFTSGAWQTRELNTVEGDNIVSLISNEFTLQKGKYLIEAIAPAYRVNEHQLRIANVSDTTYKYGSSEYTQGSTDGVTSSEAKQIVIISSAKTFRVEHRCTTTKTTDGFGVEGSFGGDEVYAQVKITKLQ